MDGRGIHAWYCKHSLFQNRKTNRIIQPNLGKGVHLYKPMNLSVSIKQLVNQWNHSQNINEPCCEIRQADSKVQTGNFDKTVGGTKLERTIILISHGNAPTISNHQRTRVIMNRSPEYYGHSRIRCTGKRKFKFINKGNTLGHWGKDKRFSEFC